MVSLGKICTNLRNIRKHKGFTQGEIADKLGISQNYLSSMESGKRTPPIEVIISLIEIYSVSPNELFGYEETTSQQYPDLRELKVHVQALQDKLAELGV